MGCHFVLWGSSPARDQAQVSCIADTSFTVWATRIPSCNKLINCNGKESEKDYLCMCIYLNIVNQLSQFSKSIMSDSLGPHGLQHARLPCPSPAPGTYSNSCPSSWWCHPTILSSVVPFSSHLQSFPASGSFPMNRFFTSDGQSIRVSASAWVLPVNIQDWYPLGLTGWISLQSKGLSRIFSNTTVQK